MIDNPMRPPSGIVPASPLEDGYPDPEIDVELEALGLVAEGDATFEEDDDGGVVIDLEPSRNAVDPAAAMDHGANLAEYMDETALSGLGSELLEAAKADHESRAEWEKAYIAGIKLLGLKVENRVHPFKGACGVFDPLLAEAVLRFHAAADAELFPPSGPAKTKVVGVETDEVTEQASRIKEWMNYYLTELAPEFYEDGDRMLMWLPLVGSTFKKTYQDPILGRPVSPFIGPDDFIVSDKTTSLATCPRMAHRFPLSRREMVLRQLSGFYRHCDLGEPPESTEIDKTETKKAIEDQQGTTDSITVLRDDSEYQNYEFHVDHDLAGFEHEDENGRPTGMPLPYIITVEEQSQKVLAIRRNWTAGDETFQKRNFFTAYHFFPGLGFYGIGLSHILGGYAKASTSILRQLVDAGTLANFPGGVRVKGMRIEDNNTGIGPTEFRELDTAGMPIRDALMMMPYKEPSVVLKELRNEISEAGRRLSATTEIAVGEGRQDAPVGTTLALMEAATKLQSSVLKRAHRSLKAELRMIADLMGEYLGDDPYPFPVQGGELAVMKADFDGRVDVIPVSDPNISSSAQRLMRAEGMLRTAMSWPEGHDIRNAFHRVYTAMGVEDVDKLLPPPEEAQPLDPVTENQNAVMGTPLRAAEWQDHESHITVHSAMMEMPAMQSHVAEHVAQKFRLLVQEAMGQQLPPLGAEMPPEVQNAIAFAAAQAVEKIKAEMEAENPSPAALAMKDLEIKAADVAQRMSIAKLKAQTDSYKAFLGFESDARDRESDEYKTELRVMADLADNEVQPPPVDPKSVVTRK